MSDISAIEWTDATWNFLAGCSRVSEGCDNCYAFALHDMRHAISVQNGGLWRPGGKPMPKQYGKPFSEVQLLSERLEAPLHEKRSKRIFVNSMSDFLHSTVPSPVILRAMEVMRKADWHVFQILTKRAGRLKRLEWELTLAMQEEALQTALGGETVEDLLVRQQPAHVPRALKVQKLLAGDLLAPLLTGQELTRVRDLLFTWPPNAWMGVSIELDRYTARADALRKVNAAVRFLSCEPLLGPLPHLNLEGIHWVITGGESGKDARPCDPAWIRDIRDRCQERGVAFFHKQWGGRTSKSGGRLLDGRLWDEFPQIAPSRTSG